MLTPFLGLEGGYAFYSSLGLWVLSTIVNLVPGDILGGFTLVRQGPVSWMTPFSRPTACHSSFLDKKGCMKPPKYKVTLYMSWDSPKASKDALPHWVYRVKAGWQTFENGGDTPDPKIVVPVAYIAM